MPDLVTTGMFDVREANLQLNRAKRRINIVSGGLATFFLAIVLWLLFAELPRALNGSLSVFGLFLILVTVVWLVVLTSALVWGIWRKRPGAEVVQVDSHGMSLEISGRAPVHVLWSDPTLRMELHDLSKVDASLLAAQTTHYLRLREFYSALTERAYDAILEQVGSHCLVDQVGPASRWFWPAGVVRHRVSGRSMA